MVRLALSLLLTTSAASSYAYIQYSTVTGYFLQDVNTTNATTFDYVRRIDRRYPILEGISLTNIE